MISDISVLTVKLMGMRNHESKGNNFDIKGIYPSNSPGYPLIHPFEVVLFVSELFRLLSSADYGIEPHINSCNLKKAALRENSPELPGFIGVNQSQSVFSITVLSRKEYLNPGAYIYLRVYMNHSTMLIYNPLSYGQP